jgi:glyoxylate/hydroxypyruvate reductase
VRIVVLTPNDPPEKWFLPIKSALTEHEVLEPASVTEPLTIDSAVLGWGGWQDVSQYRSLQFVQTNFMGIDALLQMGGIENPNTVIARMVDPGMPVAMTESVLAHVLYAHRQLDVYARQASHRQWVEHRQPFAHEVTVGVLGLGELGRRCAQAIAKIGFRVVGWSRRGADVDGVEVRTDLVTVLRRSQILVNLLPLTPATQEILCAQTLSLLPQGAVLINVARGGHINDRDLLDSLNSGQIRHAILDAFHREPLPNDHAYWDHEHVTVLPHVAASSDPRSCLPVIIENLRRVADGKLPLHIIDREAGY